ncbi:hypothetical protein A8924_3977 [Saccharopolyspora erythraea NRRL 2338]|nr:hypothetical protein A8924_3977 [Saccharopolyspora erythraea NRRL 2338]
MLTGRPHVVADVGTRGELGEALDRAAVTEKLAEQLPQRGDVAARREQRRLRLRVHAHAPSRQPALDVVGVQQVRRGVAAKRGGELPAEVDPVLHAQVEPRPATGGVHVRRVAHQEHPPVPETCGDAGIATVQPAQHVRPVTRRRFERHIHPEHAANAPPHLPHAHRLVAGRLVPLLRRDQRRLPRQRRVGEPAALGALRQERQHAAVAGHLQSARRRIHPLLRNRGVGTAPGGPVVGDARKADPGTLSGDAVGPVGPHEIATFQLVPPVRPHDLGGDRLVVL